MSEENTSSHATNLVCENLPGKRKVNAEANWQRLLRTGNADAEGIGSLLRETPEVVSKDSAACPMSRPQTEA